MEGDKDVKHDKKSKNDKHDKESKKGKHVQSPSKSKKDEVKAQAHTKTKPKTVAKADKKKSKHHDIGNTALLSKDGYESVLKVKDNDEMQNFILRTMDELELAVKQKSSSGFHGLVPYYSGVKGGRTYGALKQELQKIANLPNGWCAHKASSARLSHSGFASVLDFKDNDETATFVRRLIAAELDARVNDEKAFKEFLRWYNGDKGTGSFEVMVEQLHNAVNQKKPWLKVMHSPLKNEGKDCWDACHGQIGHCDWCGLGNACCPPTERSKGPQACKGVVLGNRKNLDEDAYLCGTPIVAATVPLNEDGYSAVVRLKNGTHMERFIRRVADKLDMIVKNDKGLDVLVPFYSGEKKDARTYAKLETELKGIGKAPDNWLIPRGGSASLDEHGYQSIALMGSAEMAKFIRRSCEDMKLAVTKGAGVAWLNGVASFYSDVKTRSNWETLKKELTRVKNNPVGRLTALHK